jgi:LysM repeat protein
MLGKLVLAILIVAALGFTTARVGHAQAAPDSDHREAGHLEVVAPGDNLFRIAQRHSTTVEALVHANQLASPDWIAVGQLLRIPASDGSIVLPADLTIQSPKPASGGTTAGGGVGGGVGGTWFAGDSIGGARIASAAPAYSLPPAAAEHVRYPSGRRIVIDLSDQTLTAYDNGAVAGYFVVSTGKPTTPTVLGNYAIYSRYVSQDMSGPGYYAPGVPFVQYFWSGYSIHGTYWHNDFGMPVSHGCVNMQTPEAQWVWDWASIGTPVTVQP